MFGRESKRHDPDRIDVDDESQVRHWSQALGVSEEELRTAVEFAGSSAAEVRNYLNRQHSHA
ncbi:MAG TPA: DUF3606 domain-containing protein [Burkholderiales bacterium]|nr:DUF3606 domain-containing protein [Burkholderiales bacterium]